MAGAFDILNETLLTAAATTGAGTAHDVSDKNYLTWCVHATSIVATTTADGAVLTFQGSPDESKWGSVSSVTAAGTTAATQTITADGNYFYNVPTAWSMKQIRPNITTFIQGSYTVYLMGKRAI